MFPLPPPRAGGLKGDDAMLVDGCEDSDAPPQSSTAHQRSLIDYEQYYPSLLPQRPHTDGGCTYTACCNRAACQSAALRDNHHAQSKRVCMHPDPAHSRP